MGDSDHCTTLNGCFVPLWDKNEFLLSQLPVTSGPEESHKDNQRSRTPLLCKKAEKVRIVQSREEKAPKRRYSGLPVFKRDLQDRWGENPYQGP